MGNAQTGGNGDLRIHRRVLQSTPTALRIGLDKPGSFRTEGGFNEHMERHKTAIGPLSGLSIQVQMLAERDPRKITSEEHKDARRVACDIAKPASTTSQ